MKITGRGGLPGGMEAGARLLPALSARGRPREIINTFTLTLPFSSACDARENAVGSDQEALTHFGL